MRVLQETGMSITSIATSHWKADGSYIASHAGTVWMGQIAVMAFAVTDTFITGRIAPGALAALSVGTAIFISIYIGLQGFIQTLLPIWAQLHGAQQPLALGASVRQSLYVTLVACVLGILVLLQGGAIMQLVRVPAALRGEVNTYLHIQALALPLALLGRVFNTFSQSMGQARWVTRLQMASLAVKVPLSLWLGFGGLGVPALGLAGCALATLITYALFVLAACWLLRHHADYAPYQVWQRLEAPHMPTLRAFLRLGLPGAFTIWIEVTSFTAMALLIAPFGTLASGSQQIAGNVAAVLYMWPLALAIATSARISYWHGAGYYARAQVALRTGLLLSIASAMLAAIVLILLRHQVAGWYADASHAALIEAAAALLPLVALYHIADAAQVTALFALRCYHVVRMPAAVYGVLLWGIGIGGGYMLSGASWAWLGIEWRGAPAFWLASLVGLSAVAAILLWLLARVAAQASLEHVQR